MATPLDMFRGNAVDAMNEDVVTPELPGGRTPEQFKEDADRGKPQGYVHRICTALDLYRGYAAADTRAHLAKVFPKTFEKMAPINMPVLKYVVRKHGTVFAGEGKFEILDPKTREAVDEAGGVKWSDVVTDAEAPRILQSVNRETRLLRRMFVRVTWDADREALCLTPFTPDHVHVLFSPDARGSLARAEGVLFDLEDAWIDGKCVKRWEFWSADPEAPANFIIDEKGNVTGTYDKDGVEQFTHEYALDDGTPILPIVSFADEDAHAGYWLLPSDDLIEAQRTENALWTDLLHVVKRQGWGQWISETQSGATNPEGWTAETAPPPASGAAPGMFSRVQRIFSKNAAEGTVTFSPDSLVQTPYGLTLKWEAQNAPIEKSLEAIKSFVRHFLQLQSVPPGDLLGDARQTVSGYALMVENQPLREIREEQIALYRRPVHDLINVMRLVFNAHQETDATRFRGLVPKWTPGDVGAPVDPVQENADDDFDLRNRLKTRAEVLAKRESISLDEAETRIAAVDAKTPAVNRVPATAVASMLLNRPTTPQAPAQPTAGSDNANG